MKKILLIILISMVSTWNVQAAAPTRAFTYVANNTIDPAQNNTNENALYSYLQVGVDTYAAGSITGAAVSSSASIPYVSLSLSGSIVNADISSSAAISDSKLAQITTASKVSTAALTGSLVGLAYAVPAGGIIMWSGSIVSIPTGWVICDGTNGTPDLRDRFVVGAGTTYSVGGTGGATTHTHSVSNLGWGTAAAVNVSGQLLAGPTDGGASWSNNSITSGSGSSLPPYYALAYIQKT